jgi:hypothetical protein
MRTIHLHVNGIISIVSLCDYVKVLMEICTGMTLYIN